MRTSWAWLASLAFAARLALAALVVALGLLPKLAWASGSGAEVWAAGCPAERGLSARVAYRAEELLLFEVEPGGLRVEVRPDSPRSFRHAGAFGVSPVGEFADWNQEPAARRQALESFVTCLLADPSLAFTGEALRSSERSTPRSAGAAAPWLLLGGLAALAVALGRARDLRGKLLWLAGLSGVALAFRAVALPWAYFHQNGQGPLWIDYALGEPSPYGPGYREVFAWVARWALDRGYAPDLAVFVAQAVLGALVVPAGWLLAHRAGARPALCLAVASLLAIDPSLARAAQSESYYATLASLLFLATAALSLGVTRQRTATVDFGLGVLGAGLFIAQAARLHPIGWIAAATVPLACLALPGRVSARLARTALAALGIGAVTALGAGRVLHGIVTGGELGGQWLPQALARLSNASIPPTIGLLLIVVFVLRRRAFPPLLALVVCVGAATTANLLGGGPALILGGYWHLYAPALVVAGAALVAELARGRRAATALALVVASGGAALAVVSWPALTREPTDVREQAWAMEWRKTLPAGARVAYVERVGARVLRLPLFGDAVRALYLEPGATRVAAPTHAGQLYYVRTSLCASAEGRDRCRRFEEQHRLRPVVTRTLPAIASLPYLTLPEAAIDVGLYEVLPR
jgi:hypothetical protein